MRRLASFVAVLLTCPSAFACGTAGVFGGGSSAPSSTGWLFASGGATSVHDGVRTRAAPAFAIGAGGVLSAGETLDVGLLGMALMRPIVGSVPATTELGGAVRVASKDFARGLGVALDVGAFGGVSGEKRAGGLGAITVGLPHGVQTTLLVEAPKDARPTPSLLLGIDLGRL